MLAGKAHLSRKTERTAMVGNAPQCLLERYTFPGNLKALLENCTAKLRLPCAAHKEYLIFIPVCFRVIKYRMY
jgi:hypothetical protein